jgi:sugar O-acyltransferase (sialic acid O-acetyltransferase NeuD family)|tara:strand:- start:15977 stop:16633 length:657 start_codon:yes stop_codon:yes gene_type:complete
MNKSKPIWYIYGCGGLGLETMDILEDNIRHGIIEDHNCIFVVDGVGESHVDGYDVIDFTDTLRGSKITIAVGEPAVRKTLLEKVLQQKLLLSSVISQHAFVSNSAVIDNGVIVAPFVSIQAQAHLGENVAINTQAIIGHHVTVMAGSVISSQVNLGGSCVVHKLSYVGMGALILEKVSVGSESIVGMGSVVYRDIPDGVIALGNPARVARKNEDKKVF